jgi:hypothetical protein
MINLCLIESNRRSASVLPTTGLNYANPVPVVLCISRGITDFVLHAQGFDVKPAYCAGDNIELINGS